MEKIARTIKTGSYRIFGFVVLFELIAIALITAFILRNIRNKHVSVHPLAWKNTVFISKPNLKYYYEPAPGITEVDNSPWLNSPVRYTINRDSLNERRDYPFNKEGSAFRIITLGDSFTFGQNVDTKNNWTELLEDSLNAKLGKCGATRKAEVINLGVRGYDLQYAVERFASRGLKYNPDLVIWMVKDDDLDHIEDEVIPLRTEMVNQLKKDGKYVNGSENSLNGARILFNMFSKRMPADKIEMIQSKTMEKYDSMYKGMTVFINYESFRQRNNAIFEELERRKTNILAERLIKYGNDLNYAPYDYHLNANGNKVVADAVVGLLSKHNIPKCNSN